MSFTNAQLAQKISDMIDHWATFAKEYSDWLAGAVDGGPGSDGAYPLTDWYGTEYLVNSPAKLQDTVDNLVSGAQGYANAASASASAAAASESNASTSAATATAQAALADADRVAAEAAEANATSAQTVATTQSNLASDRAGYAQEWANKAEDSLISVAAGGDNVDDYSAMHHATKASASAAAALVSETNAAASAAAAATFDPALYAALADNETVTGQYTFSHASGILIGAAPLTATLIGQWNTAYSWGNHASAGYMTDLVNDTTPQLGGNLDMNGNYISSTFHGVATNVAIETITTGNWSKPQGWSRMVNAASAATPSGASHGYAFITARRDFNGGYGVMYQEYNTGKLWSGRSDSAGDPSWVNVWTSADFANNSANWNTAYGWGDHAGLYLSNTGVASHSGDISFSNILGDRITLWGTHDNAASYAIGIEGGTMYFKGDAQYRWYFDQNADGGVGHTMELTPTSLLLAADNGEGDVRLIIEADRNNVGVETDQAELWLAQDGRGVTGYFRTRDDNNLEIGSSTGIGTFVTPVMSWAYNSNAVTFPGTITSGDHTIDGITLSDSNHRSGLLETHRLGTTSWSGFMIEFSSTAHWAIFGQQAQFGLYDDTNSDWILRYNENAALELMYNGSTKFATESTGINVTGQIDIDNLCHLTDSSGGSLRVTTTHGYVDIGPQNTSWCHLNSDRNFYFNRRVDINGAARRYGQGAILHNGSSSYVSGKVTFSTAAASGGSSGDIWFQYS